MMMRFARATAGALWALGIPAAIAAAQCPDGTPPPCRGVAPAAVRRPAPALDERTWIVVPFENVARVADIEWLRDASVNLLYLDMSKWRDIRVIDDERVADLIREVPEARGGAQLTLQSGLAVARRAGAGKLVMGDLLKIGAKTQIVGKVFDVRSGQRLRTVRQDALTTDSIMVSFGQLARAVLNVAPPEGTSLGTIGTSSVGAYQAYLAGVGHLNRWILDSAKVQFNRALSLDSTFALAHYKLSLVYGWDSPSDPEGARHANLALRLGGDLPPRERSLVRGYAALADYRYGEACEVFAGMTRADSSDVEAWYNFGECTYHDPLVLPVPGDTARLAFRTSWNQMLRSFRKTLELDPSYHLAFQHIQDALLVSQRAGCRPAAGETNCLANNTAIVAALRRVGDTLVIEPVNTATPAGSGALAAHFLQARVSGARRQNLLEASRAAEAWLAAGPNEIRPRAAIAKILLRLGQVSRADSIFRGLPYESGSRTETATAFAERIEIAVKLGRGAEAAALVDSIRARTDPVPGARNLGIMIAGVVGRTSGLVSTIQAVLTGPQWVKDYFALQAASAVGAPAEGLFAAESVFVHTVGPLQGLGRAWTFASGSLTWADPRIRGNRWPSVDTGTAAPNLMPAVALALGDTTRFRLALATLDSLSDAGRDEPDYGLALASAQFYLVVADTVGALKRLRFFRDVTWSHSPVQDQLGNGFMLAGMLWPRTLLLLADLAAATGQRDEAIRAYRLVLEMWRTADPELQPAVQRARSALAKLGG